VGDKRFSPSPPSPPVGADGVFTGETVGEIVVDPSFGTPVLPSSAVGAVDKIGAPEETICKVVVGVCVPEVPVSVFVEGVLVSDASRLLGNPVCESLKEGVSSIVPSKEGDLDSVSVAVGVPPVGYNVVDEGTALEATRIIVGDHVGEELPPTVPSCVGGDVTPTSGFVVGLFPSSAKDFEGHELGASSTGSNETGERDSLFPGTP
jgi:hypothetical protein